MNKFFFLLSKTWMENERNISYFDSRASVCISLSILFDESTEQIIWRSHFPQVPPSALQLISEVHRYLNLKPAPQKIVNITAYNPREGRKTICRLPQQL